MCCVDIILTYYNSNTSPQWFNKSENKTETYQPYNSPYFKTLKVQCRSWAVIMSMQPSTLIPHMNINEGII